DTIDTMEVFESVIEEIDPDWNFHDFRIREEGNDLVKVYFDLVVPYEEKRDVKEIEALVQSRLPDHPKYVLYIKIEHPYS
ncbi:MAG: cation-efflux pump, partial [Ileibacterium sp.]|nr:cation-efflux pump [Ileibacterium sp.]